MHKSNGQVWKELQLHFLSSLHDSVRNGQLEDVIRSVLHAVYVIQAYSSQEAGAQEAQGALRDRNIASTDRQTPAGCAPDSSCVQHDQAKAPHMLSKP